MLASTASKLRNGVENGEGWTAGEKTAEVGEEKGFH